MTTSSDPKQFDIAIVGGAMAGATLALGLANLAQKRQQVLRIALIEANRPGDGHPGFDARSIAIAQGSIFELTRLGIWPKLAHLGTAIENIHVSDRGHFGMTTLNAKDFHLPYLGQVVELERVGAKLFSLLEQQDVSLFCPSKVASIVAGVDAQQLMLDDGTALSAKLVVAADGLHSKVRQDFKLPLEQVDFEQVAVVANVLTDKPHQEWAYERFTDSGPLAILPMANVDGQSRVSLVWALAPEHAELMLGAEKPAFLDALQDAFGHRAGRFIDVGERYAYPLKLSYMARPIYQRTVFIGNAAQTLHPIAGQGFNLGLRDLVCLLEVVDEALERGEDIGGAKLTHEYLSRRRQDRDTTITNVEFLVRGFSNQHWPLVAGRNLGLRLLSWCPPLKTPIARKAMGWKSPQSASQLG
ncbi:2-octaprenyl-6-methoxyphenyl hydroxylase [Shewanella loihica]|uniref:2-octaprenyl-3-methyl-6-methoxy-1,4-benzoquinol hydroxylase / 2-octaprenyl-6-methoxyphenol hydroxylase n=1 Tax=Shewanella loihica (strain ATCC BAA-1088 / PV-4) TaxID=323850 RepID=A3QHI4_SHELP|nr:2-octaprenyl-6-methoxyphenyl hydroxylase [Shewanella loihica]ABO24932.1 2-octaprenyl-3-methyl-6-methoxy-1,4-benzoquinol hydroxylase / 2-octaprenyl-6-methoxyphenol hydroxylase [Shewanella loihica PV-4]